MNNWFDVDKDGLAKLMERKGKEFVLFELIQNALDEAVTTVSVTLERIPNSPFVQLIVEDDSPEGFSNLTHAYTLFAESKKKANVEKRGRFNLGEKLVLALCREASIVTTKGTVIFNESGRRLSSSKLLKGSIFTGSIRMRDEEIETCNEAVKRLLIPEGVLVMYNGTKLVSRPALRVINLRLPTEIADPEGYLKRAVRDTTVGIYEVLPYEVGMLYELGIPVTETGDKFHYNIGQKVPLTLDRENVPPAYLKEVRGVVLNSAVDMLSREDTREKWVSEALESREISPTTLNLVLDGRFGEKRVAFDPSDVESNKRAVSEGYTVVHGGMLSGQAWSNVRDFGALQPAGKVTPSHKTWTGEDNPDAQVFNDWIPEEKWSGGMKSIADYSKMLARYLMQREIVVKFCSTPHHLGAASYGGGELTFNKLRLGSGWFERGITVDVDSLIIHEFGHEYSPDHLSEDYYKALTDLGAKLKRLALHNPSVFEKF